MARACKNVTRAVIGQYSGPDFTVMPTGIIDDVNARLVKRDYRKCKSSFDLKSSNDLKLEESDFIFESFYFFLCDINFLVRKETAGF